MLNRKDFRKAITYIAVCHKAGTAAEVAQCELLAHLTGDAAGDIQSIVSAERHQVLRIGRDGAAG